MNIFPVTFCPIILVRDYNDGYVGSFLSSITIIFSLTFKIFVLQFHTVIFLKLFPLIPILLKLGLLLFQIWLHCPLDFRSWRPEHCTSARFCRWEALIQPNGEQKAEVIFSTSCCRNSWTLCTAVALGSPAMVVEGLLIRGSNAAPTGQQ